MSFLMFGKGREKFCKRPQAKQSAVEYENDILGSEREKSADEIGIASQLGQTPE